MGFPEIWCFPRVCEHGVIGSRPKLAVFECFVVHSCLVCLGGCCAILLFVDVWNQVGWVVCQQSPRDTWLHHAGSYSCPKLGSSMMEATKSQILRGEFSGLLELVQSWFKTTPWNSMVWRTPWFQEDLQSLQDCGPSEGGGHWGAPEEASSHTRRLLQGRYGAMNGAIAQSKFSSSPVPNLMQWLSQWFVHAGSLPPFCIKATMLSLILVQTCSNWIELKPLKPNILVRDHLWYNK